MKRWVILGTVTTLTVLGVALGAHAQQISVRRERTGGAVMVRAQRGGMGFGEMGGLPLGQRLLAMLDNPKVRTALNLTDDQATKLRQIVVNTEKATIKTRADMQIQGIDLRELMLQDKPDRDTVMKDVDALSSLHGDMMKEYADAVLQAKDILTPEQQQKIRTFIEMRGMMRGRAGMMGRGMNGMMRRGMRGGMGPNPAPPKPPNPPSPPNP